MKREDLADFKRLLHAVCGMLSRGAYKPDETSEAIFFNALRSYDLQTVKAAFAAHCADPQRGRFAPVPADILAQIEGAAANDGRPEADEAWGVAVKAFDEDATIIWTEETAAAWCAAKPIWDIGDKVGARVAFKAAYGRMVDEARRNRVPMRTNASLGDNKDARDDVLRIGVAAGQIPAAYLPAPAAPVAGLLEVSKAQGCPDHIRERLRALREDLAQRMSAPSADFAAKQRTAELKAEALAKIEAAGS